MGIRLLDTEHLVAVGFGAGDALVTAKVKGMGPGGIPWPVLYEGVGVVAGLFGSKVGIPPAVRDSVLISSLALAGSRLSRVAMAGKLMTGPKAWGGDSAGGDFNFGDPSQATGGAALPAGSFPAAFAGRPGLRALTGRGGGWSISGAQVPFAEAPGVLG